jgi:hypothetical protein
VQLLRQQLGWTLGGPAGMLVLAVALFFVLRLYKRLGLLSRLAVLDYAILVIVTAYGVYVAVTVLRVQLHTHEPVTLDKLLHWSGDPLISLLLFEAVLIRRAIVDMGWGFIAKCWGAFAVAILLTSLGSMGQWAANFGYLPWPRNAIVWYVWYPVSAAFALGPAYQLEAIWKAEARRDETGSQERLDPGVRSRRA